MLDTTLRRTLFPIFLALAGSAVAETVTLQQGLNGYSGTTDTWITSSNTSSNWGNAPDLQLRAESQEGGLIRFAIFASEGGPVPNNAIINSATLSLYKFQGPSAVYKASRLLKSFNETQATWNIAATGTSWTSPGAQSAGNDYLAAADGQGSVGDAAADACTSAPYSSNCWLHIDVSAGVQAFRSGTPNRGWKIAQISSSGINFKNFNSKNNPYFPSLRPKLTVTYTVASGNTVTLRQHLNGYGGTTDTWITSSNPTSNWGAAADLQLRAETQEAALIRFNIFQSEGGPVPNGANITSATLSLYKFQGPSATYKVSRLLRSFTEMQATWNVAASGSSWTTPGAAGAGSDYLAVPDGTGSVGDAAADACTSSPYPATCWLNMDVTAGVQAFRSGVPNYGWKVSQTSSSGINFKNFNSRDNKNTQFFPLLPTLTITYQSCVAPTAQFSVSTSGTTATFDASASTDGDSPITSLTLQFGDGQQVTWSNKAQAQQHTYAAGGYTATLTASSACGTSAPATQQVGVTTPKAKFTVTQTDGSTTVVFDASSSEDNGPAIDNLVLSYGDGTPNDTWTTKSQTKSHNYAPGTYNAQLTVSNSNGSSTAEQTVTVPGAPQPSFTAVQTPGTTTVVFNAQNTKHGGDTISELRLNFGDNQQSAPWTDKNTPQSHNYAPGPYTVVLAATNKYGSPTASQQITVTDPNNTEYNSPLNAVPPGQGETRATFHSMSLYYNPDGHGPSNPPAGNRLLVRYRKASENPNAPGFIWKEGFPLWYDTRNAGDGGFSGTPYSYRGRGSVVYLLPGTKYVFELGKDDGKGGVQWLHHMVETTWSETFQIAGTPETILPRQTTLVISSGGSAGTGYKVYDGGNNHIQLPGNSSHPECVRITVPYVIVRRVKCTGGWKYGITVAAGVTNVVIEDNDISDWSRFQGGTRGSWSYGGNEYGGVQLQGNNSQIVVQRNKIYDPRFGSFPWDHGHPLGATGIMMFRAGKQNVVRYNEIYATGHTTNKAHWLYDGIMGTENFSETGAPGSDSDIYQNIVRNVMDDGIEAEGNGMNVRVWGNYIDHASAAGIATTTAHWGPIYVFRNVLNRSRKMHNTSTPDADGWERGVGFKSYGKGFDDDFDFTAGGGRQYFFHNTILQQPGSGTTWALGANESITGKASNNDGMRETWTRNNIFHTVRSDSGASIRIGSGAYNNTFDYDLHSRGVDLAGASGTYEQNGILSIPTYKSGHGWSAFPRLSVETDGPGGNDGAGLGVGVGQFQLKDTAPVSPGLNAGQPLPNFTYHIDNTALARKSGVATSATDNPDPGAHDSASTEQMKFGLSAGQ